MNESYMRLLEADAEGAACEVVQIVLHRS